MVTRINREMALKNDFLNMIVIFKMPKKLTIAFLTEGS